MAASRDDHVARRPRGPRIADALGSPAVLRGAAFLGSAALAGALCGVPTRGDLFALALLAAGAGALAAAAAAAALACRCLRRTRRWSRPAWLTSIWLCVLLSVCTASGIATGRWLSRSSRTWAERTGAALEAQRLARGAYPRTLPRALRDDAPPLMPDAQYTSAADGSSMALEYRDPSAGFFGWWRYESADRSWRFDD